MATKKQLTLGEKLKVAREEKGITMKELASNVYVSERMIYYYEEDIRVPPVKTAVKLADILGVSLDYLLRD